MYGESPNGNFDERPPVDVEEYDNSIRLYSGAYDEIFRLSYCCLSASLSKCARVLIVGAGTGKEIAEFAPLNPGWSFCGVDPSNDMLNLARKKLSQKNLSSGICLINGYVNDLEDEEVFDGATCILVMHFLKDDGAKLALLESISQHLKPGAPLVLVDGFGDPDSIAFKDTVKTWKQYPIMNGVAPESVENAFDEVIMKMIQFVPESRILDLLNEAGFSRVYKFYSGFLYGGWTAYKE
jgi:tRNA (cmo5U34)-methyltransferase